MCSSKCRANKYWQRWLKVHYANELGAGRNISAHNFCILRQSSSRRYYIFPTMCSAGNSFLRLDSDFTGPLNWEKQNWELRDQTWVFRNHWRLGRLCASTSPKTDLSSEWGYTNFREKSVMKEQEFHIMFISPLLSTVLLLFLRPIVEWPKSEFMHL